MQNLDDFNNNIEKLNKKLEESNIQYFLEIIGKKREIVKRNFLAGISRGVGIGIGVTIITAVLIIFLEKIVTLNVPVIGEYVAEIIEVVENKRY